MSAERGRRGARALLGKASANEKKHAVEGMPEFEKIIWGLVMSSLDVEGGHRGPGTITLPPLKIEKCRTIFRDPEFDPGVRRLRIHLV